MNKNDIKLILILVVFILVFFLYKFNNDSNKEVAYVYYMDRVIEKIPLKEDKQYTVKGFNGDVVIEVLNNKIRVVEENSPRHLCSKQGYSDVIICLPNKIIIKVKKNDEELDGVVR